MVNWSLFILGLVATSSLVWADNSYLVVVPKFVKTGSDNQVSVFIGVASQPVDVKFELIVGHLRIEIKTTCNAGETCNGTLSIPLDWPVGASELRVIGTGGVQFEERRDVIIYDDRHGIFVQTSSSNYHSGDILEVWILATDENLIPIENDEVTIKIYDATLKLVGEYPRVPVRSGLTETIRFPLYEHVNMGTWLVSATIGNTTSSVKILVARPVTPSFDLKAIFQRFLLRTDKTLRGSIEINSDDGNPILGRATIAVGQMTKEDISIKPKHDEDYRNWKSQSMEIAGRVELNYDLESLFNIDVNKALAVQIYIEVTDLNSGQRRIVRNLIPVFTDEVIYDIRPLGFEAGVKNEFEILAKRPDGKPTNMEELIVNIRMLLADEKQEKLIEVIHFYTRDRNDTGLFNFDIPRDCMVVLFSLTPLDADGKQSGYRTHDIPLMPMPSNRSNGAKLLIELAPASKNADGSLVSTPIVTVGQTANFYIQLLPLKSVDKFEPLTMSYILLTNGKITLTGQLAVQPTKECQTQTPRAIQPEQQTASACVFNGTLSFPVTRKMVPYSTLLVYTFQPSFGFNVTESYRFSVAGLFQSTLALNATVVPSTPIDSTNRKLNDESSESSEEDIKPALVSSKAQGKTQVELSFITSPDSTVGVNVIEFDPMLQGLPNEITKDPLLRYLTRYEQLPINGMPTAISSKDVLLPRELQMLDERSPTDLEEDEQSDERHRRFNFHVGPADISSSGVSFNTPVGNANLGVHGLAVKTPVGNLNGGFGGASFQSAVGTVGVNDKGRFSAKVDPAIGNNGVSFNTPVGKANVGVHGLAVKTPVGNLNGGFGGASFQSPVGTVGVNDKGRFSAKVDPAIGNSGVPFNTPVGKANLGVHGLAVKTPVGNLNGGFGGASFQSPVGTVRFNDKREVSAKIEPTIPEVKQQQKVQRPHRNYANVGEDEQSNNKLNHKGVNGKIISSNGNLVNVHPSKAPVSISNNPDDSTQINVQSPPMPEPSTDTPETVDSN